jgi:hypothetical protein
MKRGLLTLIAALLAGIAGFVLTSRSPGVPVSEDRAEGHASPVLPELDWLRHEFKLTEEQFARVSALHLAYRPTCEILCEKIIVSRNKVTELVVAGKDVSPGLREAFREHAHLLAECQSAMLEHLYETAAVLPPDQAKRYLEAMIPHVIDMTMDHKPGSGTH